MISGKKFTFVFFYFYTIAEYLSFALIISSDKSQSKAQFNTQSLTENEIGDCGENIDFSTDENFKISPHLLALIFIPS